MQSRYYDPQVGRFINADGIIGANGGIMGYNMFAYCNNNPVMFVDPSGMIAMYYPLVGEHAKTGGGGMIGYALAAGALSVGVGVAASQITEQVEEKIEEHKEHEEPSYTVYVLVNSDQTVQCVGRTKSPAKRAAAHRIDKYRNHLDFIPVESGLSYQEARGLEQIYMLYFHTINTDNKANNQINGIRLTNDKRGIYLGAAKKFWAMHGI